MILKKFEFPDTQATLAEHKKDIIVCDAFDFDILKHALDISGIAIGTEITIEQIEELYVKLSRAYITGDNSNFINSYNILEAHRNRIIKRMLKAFKPVVNNPNKDKERVIFMF